MKEIQSNINIVGGGLIGVAAAYSLSKLGNKVVVLEQKAKFNHRKILDKRTTAISEGTKKFFEKININSFCIYSNKRETVLAGKSLKLNSTFVKEQEMQKKTGQIQIKLYLLKI